MTYRERTLAGVITSSRPSGASPTTCPTSPDRALAGATEQNGRVSSRRSDAAGAGEGGPQVWQPPALSRAMNALVTCLLAGLMAGQLVGGAPGQFRWPLLGLLTAVALLIAARGLRGALVVDSQQVVYHGILHTVRIDRGDLLAFTDSSAEGRLARFVDVPVLWWRDGQGRRRRLRLWLFVLGPDSRIGAAGVLAVRANMTETLLAVVQMAHRKRKHRRHQP